jgi:hypothetical protein
MIHIGDTVPTVEQAILEARPLELHINQYEAFVSGNRPTPQDIRTILEQKRITIAKVGPYLHCIVLAIAILSHSSSQGNGHKISLVQSRATDRRFVPGLRMPANKQQTGRVFMVFPQEESSFYYFFVEHGLNCIFKSIAPKRRHGRNFSQRLFY